MQREGKEAEGKEAEREQQEEGKEAEREEEEGAKQEEWWVPIWAHAPQMVEETRRRTEKLILEEARGALECDAKEKMSAAVLEHGCVGFVWFKSEMAGVWIQNQQPRLLRMIDDVLPGANYCAMRGGEVCLLVPPPTNVEHRTFMLAAVQQFGAWVWDFEQARAQPIEVLHT